MPTAEDLGRHAVAYKTITALIRQRVLDYFAATWGGLGAYRDADIDRWVATILPVVNAGLAQTASLTDAYLASVIASKTGEAATPAGVRPADVTTDALRGVPGAEVYGRAGVTVWTALAAGVPFAAAVQRGLDRAQQIAATDMQLAATHTTASVLGGDSRVAGYVRVVSGGACELCAAADGTFSRSDDLLAVHVGCSCSCEPVLRDEERPKAEPDTDVVEVHEHGEIGPVLTTPGQAFTEP